MNQLRDESSQAHIQEAGQGAGQASIEEAGQAVPVPASLLSLEALRQARDMPWKASNEIRRWLLLPLARWRLRGLRLGAGWRCYGLPIIQRHRQSEIRIGKRLELRSSPASNPLGANRPVIISARRPGASITIGDDFGMTGGSLVCDQRISIGDRVWLGANVIVADTDFHPLESERRQSQPLAANTAPVTIEDDVFVGMHALILKGITIGAGAVVAAGSVVVRDVPPGSLVAGNPARVMRDSAYAARQTQA